MKKIKSAMLILMVAIGFASFVSCGNNKNAQPNDAKAVAEALEDKEVEEMSSLINSVSLCLDSIQVQENMIFNNPEGTTDKQHMLAQLRAFKDLLARKQQQIADLTAKSEAQNKKSKKTIASLNKMVDYLNAQLAEKSARIERTAGQGAQYTLLCSCFEEGTQREGPAQGRFPQEEEGKQRCSRQGSLQERRHAPLQDSEARLEEGEGGFGKP